MADKDETEETAPRGADWEVVSLTASTYAAAPSPDPKGVDAGRNETSNALFMSGHFVFPPSQHENLPLETDVLGEQGGEGGGVSVSLKEEGEKSYEENWNTGKLAGSDDDFSDSTTLSGKEHSIYNSAKFHSEPIMGESNIEDEDRVLAESIESSDSPLGSRFPEEDNYDGSGLPYAAWLKKQAAALYSHAKETNTFWSIFIAAAVMGLVIIGQQWQQERWQVLHHKWHSGVYDEKFGRLVGPISRFKDAFIGGTRRGFSIRGSTSRDL